MSSILLSPRTGGDPAQRETHQHPTSFVCCPVLCGVTCSYVSHDTFIYTSTSNFFRMLPCVVFCALANARQTAKISVDSNLWARKQRENCIRGTELRVARGSVGAEAPPPPRTQPKSRFESVPRDTEKSEFLDSVDFESVAISAESVIVEYMHNAYQS